MVQTETGPHKTGNKFTEKENKLRKSFSQTTESVAVARVCKDCSSGYSHPALAIARKRGR
ncbi:hypothetical protein PIIN_09955 [Serendipita indica DSM 11827]|uniref:Uncharacterized protein n=1 Tax=Serendipita indica (strain DSM 11827) TaxID=1109443 RepID=G4TXB6_SERID|nr:hypothetical protein PIIN_09955 [Serendipita indica DSM 11827]